MKHITPQIAPPEGFLVITDERALAQQGDLKWCRLHQRWEPVNEDADGVLNSADFAPIRTYHAIARPKHTMYIAKAKAVRQRRLEHQSQQARPDALATRFLCKSRRDQR